MSRQSGSHLKTVFLATGINRTRRLKMVEQLMRAQHTSMKFVFFSFIKKQNSP
jgi:hypothetical protein